MLADKIRSLRAASPFQPFIIALVDGITRHVIRDPGNLMITDDGIVALIDTAHRLHIVNPFQIAQVTLERIHRKGVRSPH